jgi:serine protease Do
VGAYERVVGPGDGALDGLAVAGDAAPGDLGAPVVDARGVVAGVVTHVEEGAAWYVAPVEVVHKVVDDLLTTGEVRHARLGIEGTDATPLAGSPTAPPEGDGGAVVASVVPDSPADHGGLEAGDVVVALDGEPVTRLPDLLVRLRARSPGDTVDVGVRRADGSRATLVITLDELDREG